MTVTEFNANDYPAVYASLGINPNRLGCIMLDVDQIPVTSLVPGRENDLYWSDNPDLNHIRGPVAESTAHITLLYGLLQSGPSLKPQIDQLLNGWTPTTVTVDHVSVFESTHPGEPYSCIIAHIKTTPELAEGHQRLSLLPHINTYPTYRPHLTLAYVHRDHAERWLDTLGAQLDGKELTVNRINYGKNF